jgi:YcaO-like protein with predicted kinase domain
MKFKNYTRNEYGKCDLPHDTVRRIQEGFERLDLEPAYAAFQVSDNIHWGRIWIDSIRIICEGKGVTPELAKASAYAELAERFSAGLFYQEFEEQVRFNMPALYGDPTGRFLNFEWMDGYVHSHQDDLDESHLKIEDLLANETHLAVTDIEDIENSQMAMHWVDGFSVVNQKTIKVPVNFVSYIHASNGIAAGNTLEEAVVQASCEIFERHAQINTIKPERMTPTIDSDSVGNAAIQEMIGFYREKNVDVMLKDLSLDGLLPCIGVLFINHNLPSDRLEHKILIPGASFNLDESLTRCFTESMQGRETLFSVRPQLDRPLVHRSQVSNYYMLMRCAISLKDISFLEQGETVPYRRTAIKDILGEIDAIERICRRFETDFIILNHTHPVLGFPVVRVVIPRVSDFLPFLEKSILTAEATRPSSLWRGERFKKAMQSFFT